MDVVSITWASLAILFLGFLLWGLSVFGWGRMLGRLLGTDSLAIDLALGTAFYCLVLEALGSFTSFLSGSKGWLLLLAPGIVQGLFFLRLPRFSRYDLPLALIGTLLLARASVPNLFPDPLWYHLAVPRMWIAEGQIAFLQEAVQSGTVSHWEMLYLWVFPLATYLKSTEVGALVLAQWAHAFFGGIVSALCVRELLRRYTVVQDEWWRSLVPIAFLLTDEVAISASLAKNEWGAISWILAGALCFPRQYLLGGFLIGLGTSAKFTNIFLLVGLIPTVVWLIRSAEPRHLRVLVAACCVGLVPWIVLLARNSSWTGNPLFPSPLFSTELLPAVWVQAISHYQGVLWDSPSERGLLFKLQGLLPFENPLCYLVFLAPWILRSRSLPWRVLLPLGLLFVALAYLFGTGGAAEARLVALLPTTISALSILIVAELQQRFFPRPLQRLLLQALAVFLLINQWQYPWKIFGASIESQVREQSALVPCLLEYSLHAPVDYPVDYVYLHDTRVYFGVPFGARRIWDSLSLADGAQRAADFDSLERFLCNDGVQGLVYTNRVIDQFLDLALAAKVKEVVVNRSRSLECSSDEGALILLRCLPGE